MKNWLKIVKFVKNWLKNAKFVKNWLKNEIVKKKFPTFDFFRFIREKKVSIFTFFFLSRVFLNTGRTYCEGVFQYLIN